MKKMSNKALGPHLSLALQWGTKEKFSLGDTEAAPSTLEETRPSGKKGYILNLLWPKVYLDGQK